MKTWIGFMFGILLTLSMRAEDIKLASGEVIRGTISRVDPDGLVVMTDAGVEKVSFLSLPEETQKRYGFDYQKAEAFRAQQAEARRQLLEKQSAAIRERAVQVQEMEKNQPSLEQQQQAVKIAASGFFARATVIQGMRKGVRVKLITQTGQAAATMLNQDTRQLVNLGEGFIHGMNGAEGETWEGKLFPAGYFTYDTVAGERTIRAYTTTPEEAAAKGGDGRIVAPGTSIPGSTALPKLPGRLKGETKLDR